MQSGTIICGFAGIGKTFLSNTYKNVIDLESSSYKWIYLDDVEDLNHEERKGLQNRVLNPAWPSNYVLDIIGKCDKDNIVLTSMDKEVREALRQWGCRYYVAYPDISCKDDYIERYKQRGNNEKFIETISSNFESWVQALEDETYKIVLRNGDFLETALIPLGILKK